MPRESTSSYRLPHFIDKPKLYVIAAEGQKTEPHYFDALRRHYEKDHRESRLHVHILRRPSEEEGRSAPQYVQQMLDDFLRENKNYDFQEYDELWIVIDTDKWKPETLSALTMNCQQKQYFLAVSNPCFELWLILHLSSFETVRPDIENAPEKSRKCKQLRGDLQQNLCLGGEYQDYMPFIPQAIERARALDIAPETVCPEHICTRIYLLVEKLTTLPRKYTFFNPDCCHNEKEVESKFIVNYLLPILGYHASEWQQQVTYGRLRVDFLVHQLVIETKHPANVLTDTYVQQLTDYMTIANLRYGLLTNAQELRIYEQINQNFKLIFRCFIKGIENKMAEISRLIGRDVLNDDNCKIERIDHNLSQQNGRNQMSDMKVIAIYHNKGGVGKTTVAVNLAAALRIMGKRVLLIDIDAQANATFATGLIKFAFDKDDDLKNANVFNLLEDGDYGFVPEIRRQSKDFNAPEIDVIPSHITLIDKQGTLSAFASARLRLDKKIQHVKSDYDVVIIDAPPSRDFYAEVALIAADFLIIPSDLKPFANQGLPNVRNFIRQADEMRISIGKDALKLIGVLPSKISANPQYLRHTFQIQKQTVVENYHFPLMNSRIIDRKILADCFNQDIQVGELRIADPKSIFMYDSSSDSAREFNELANEVLIKMGVAK